MFFIMKSFKLRGRDTRRWIKHSRCIQFEFDLGKRLYIGSSFIFVLFEKWLILRYLELTIS